MNKILTVIVYFILFWIAVAMLSFLLFSCTSTKKVEDTEIPQRKIYKITPIDIDGKVENKNSIIITG